MVRADASGRAEYPISNASFSSFIAKFTATTLPVQHAILEIVVRPSQASYRATSAVLKGGASSGYQRTFVIVRVTAGQVLRSSIKYYKHLTHTLALKLRGAIVSEVREAHY